jgi:hypothetical protein
MSKRCLAIERAIAKKENPYPKDDLITTYADFLKVREVLPFFSFNSRYGGRNF